MDYEKHYALLIARAKQRGEIETYTERHHIIPKCMGGSNDNDNIAVLTAAEHYVAHQLLVKMHPSKKGLVFATVMMTTGKNMPGRSKNKLYEWLRIRTVETLKNRKMSEKQKHQIREKNTNPSAERRRKMSEGCKRKPPMPDEVRQRISNTLKGRKQSKEHKENIRKAKEAKKT